MAHQPGIWQFYADRQWQNMITDYNQKLEDGLLRKQAAVTMGPPYGHDMDLLSFMQRNPYSGTMRPIRRLPPPSLPVPTATPWFQLRQADGTVIELDVADQAILVHHPRDYLFLSPVRWGHPNFVRVDRARGNWVTVDGMFDGQVEDLRPTAAPNGVVSASPGRGRGRGRKTNRAAGATSYAAPNGFSPAIAAVAAASTGAASNGATAAATSQSPSSLPITAETQALQAQQIQLEPYQRPADRNPDDDECCICIDVLDMTQPDHDVVALRVCGHAFHARCLLPCVKGGSLTCPLCSKTSGGARRGTQPEGTMTHSVLPQDCLPGYPNCGVIQIVYNFPPGVQGPEHPEPGRPYRGDSRIALLPDNAEGRQILRLFQVAFERRLIFTIGHSVTLGPAHGWRVVWAGIHHKTSPAGSYGYPDPTYFDRVRQELAAVGVTDADL